MSISGYSVYYTPPNSSTQWKIDTTQLNMIDRMTVEDLYKNPSDVVLQSRLQDIQKAFPSAFTEVKNGSGPLPAPALSDKWYIDPDSVDINFLIGLVVDLMMDIGRSLSKQSVADAYAEIADYRALADRRLQEELAAAKAEFTGAMVGAVLSAVSAAVGIAGGAGSIVMAGKDMKKLDAIGKNKADLSDKKLDYDKAAEQLELDSQKYAAKAEQHKLNAMDARLQAKKLQEPAEIKQKEINELKNKLMADPPPGKAETDDIEAQIKTKTAERAKLEDDVKDEVAALNKKAEAEDVLAAENSLFADTLKTTAKAVRVDALNEEFELDLSKLATREKDLDHRIQQHGNLTRLLSVMAPIFTSFGQIVAAIFNYDAKSTTAVANFITSEMEVTQMLKGIEDEIAKKFSDMVSEAIQFQKTLQESNNQTMANIAHNV